MSHTQLFTSNHFTSPQPTQTSEMIPQTVKENSMEQVRSSFKNLKIGQCCRCRFQHQNAVQLSTNTIYFVKVSNVTNLLLKLSLFRRSMPFIKCDELQLYTDLDRNWAIYQVLKQFIYYLNKINIHRQNFKTNKYRNK